MTRSNHLLQRTRPSSSVEMPSPSIARPDKAATPCWRGTGLLVYGHLGVKLNRGRTGVPSHQALTNRQPAEEPMATNLPTLTDKQIAAEVLGRMPESATLAEISERFAILAGLARGQGEIEAGRVVTQEEAKRRSLMWTGK